MADDGGNNPPAAGGSNIMATLASWKAGRAKLRTEGAPAADATAGAGAAPVTASARPAKMARVGGNTAGGGSRARSTPPPPGAAAAAAAAAGVGGSSGAAAAGAAGGGGTGSPGGSAAAPPTVPLAKQVKDALAILRAAEGRPLTADDMRAAGLPASYDLTPGGKLHTELARQPRVAQSTRPNPLPGQPPLSRLAYRSEHGIRDADALLRHIRARPLGTKAADVRDAYRAVLDDAERLVTRGLVIRQYSYEFACDVFFPCDARARPAQPLASEVVRLFHEVEVPAEPAELTAALRRQGMPSALATLQRRKVPPLERAQGQRKRRQQAPRNVTNAHLPELFRGAQPEAIDKR
jgi:hypothetical protein